MNKIEAKDVIAAFREGDRFYVLRPTEGGRYRVISDAYVYSLMNSEAYDDLNLDEVVLEWRFIDSSVSNNLINYNYWPVIKLN
jgi:hypothetical protein